MRDRVTPQVIDARLVNVRGFLGRFAWMRECRWTVKEIRSTFRVPSPIAEQIQSSGRHLVDAIAIAQAQHELTSGQIGF